jgi:uncharacterized membrane protein (UPF0136 family)
MRQLTILMLGGGLAVLILGGFRRRSWGALAAGLSAAALFWWGRYQVDSAALAGAGLALFVTASFWNAWTLRRRGCAAGCCAAESELAHGQR